MIRMLVGWFVVGSVPFADFPGPKLPPVDLDWCL